MNFIHYEIKKVIMTIRKFVVQLSFVFAIIIGFSACEKDPIADPMNAVENQMTENESNTTSTNDVYAKSQVDCEEFLALYTEAELEELGIDPETFCDSVEVVDNQWNDIDWQADCEELVASNPDELEALGFDLETFCGWSNGSGTGSYDNLTIIDWSTNCDSLVLVFADHLAEWGIDPATFCDSLNDDNGVNDDNGDNNDWSLWGNIDWTMDCENIVITYANELLLLGIDPETLCYDNLIITDGDYDFGTPAFCVVNTYCGTLAYGEQVEVVAENGQITVYDEDGEVLDSIECYSTEFQVNCQ